tara:strand:- start:4443 stop:19259 length:14817 start_codon:yes stop_codon:yes gene_type:complete
MNKIMRAFEVLEPRVLLDGTLDFAELNELSGEAQLETLTALFDEFTNQADPENGEDGAFVAQLRGAFFEALGDTADMFDLEEGQDGTGFGSLDDVFERVRLSLIEVLDTFRDNIETAEEYTTRLNEIINPTDGGLPLDFTGDTGLGTLLFQLTSATYPDTGVAAPDYSVDPAVESLADRLTAEFLPGSYSEFATLDGANSYTITDHTSAVYTNIFDFLTNGAHNDFIAALGDGTLTAPELQQRFAQIFSATTIEYAYDDPAWVDDPADSNDAPTELFATLTVSQATRNQIAAEFIDHAAAVDIEYYAANSDNLTDIAQINNADAAFVTFGSGLIDVSGDFLSVFTNNALFTDLFDDDALFNSSFEELLDGLLSSLSVSLTESWELGADRTFAFTLDSGTISAIGDVLKAQFNSVVANEDVSALNSLTLVDVEDGDGTDIITFGNSGGGDVLDVSIAMPMFETLLSQIDLDPALRTVLPVDFDFSQVSSTLDFQITTETMIDTNSTATRSDDTATQSLAISNIAFTSADAELDDGAVFSFGRADASGPATVTYPAPGDAGALASTAVGFLEGTLTAIETAQIDLVLDDPANLATISFDTISAYNFADDTHAETRSVAGLLDALDMSLRIRELDAVGFIDYDPNSTDEFDIARYQFTLDLPLGLDPLDILSFEASLTQSVQVDFAGFASTEPDLNPPETSPPIFLDESFAPVRENTSVRFDVGDLDGFVPDALHGAFTDLANAVWDMDTDIISTFFAGFGDGLSGALSNANFDLGIPLTDFDILDGFNPIADLLRGISDLFAATPEDFGFTTPNNTGSAGADVETYLQLSSNGTSQLAEQLSTDAIIALSEMDVLTFVDYMQNTGGYTVQEIVIVPSSLVAGATVGGVFQPGLFVTALVDEINLTLTANGIPYMIAASGATGPFSMSYSGTGDPSTRLLQLKENSGFQALGFNSTHTETRDINDLRNPADTGDDVVLEGVNVFEFYAQNSSVELGTMNTEVLRGFDSVRFNISEGNIQHIIDIQRPTTGWGIAGNELDGFIDAFNDALDAKGLQITVGLNGGSDGLAFSIDGGSEGQYAIAIDGTSLERANSLTGVMGWMTETLTELIPDFSFNIDLLTGEFLLDFDPITASVGVTAGLSIDDMPLGELSGVDLQAQLSGNLSAELNIAAGFNIFDMQATFAETDDVQDAILDNVFLSELSLSAVLDAQATEIQAGFDLGMLSISLAEGDVENFVRINAELDATLVGQDDAVFDNRITGTQLNNLGRDMGPGSDLTDLLGRFDITGGIVINEEGCPVLMGPDTDNTIDRLTIENGEDRQDDSEFAMMMLNLDGLDLDIGGLRGNILPEPLRVTVGDLFDPLNTTQLCTDFDLCSTIVDPGLILDGMIALADILDSFEQNLETFLPILGEDLPLLSGNSILDQFSFAGDFRDSLNELRDQGDFGFDTISGIFDDIFGVGNVSISLITEALNSAGDGMNSVCELFFEIDLDFLEDYFVDIPFNFDLNQLLGSDGIAGLLGSSGSAEAADALADVLTNLVDARADARLRLDPYMGLNLTLGLDLSALASSSANLVNAATTSNLSEIANVNAVLTNSGANQNDLRIDWRNLDTGVTHSIQIDVDALAVDGLPTLDELRMAIQAEFPDNTVRVELNVNDSGELQLGFFDPDSTARDDAGRDVIFDDLSLTGSDFTPLNDTYTPRDLALGNPSDPTETFEFTFAVGDPSVDHVIAIAAEIGRDIDGLVYAINDALSQVSIPSNEIDTDGTTAGDTILLQLFAITLDDGGDIQVQTTEFANNNSWDEFALSVSEGLVGGYLDAGENLAQAAFEELESYGSRQINLEDLQAYMDGLAARSANLEISDPEQATELRLEINGVEERINLASQTGRTLAQLATQLNAELTALQANPENFAGGAWPGDDYFNFVVDGEGLRMDEIIVGGDTRVAFGLTASSSVATITSDVISFALQINDADPVDIVVDVNAIRFDEAGIAHALNEALHAASVSRSTISDTGVIGTSVALSQLLRFEVIDTPAAGDSSVQLRSTNFAYLNSYDEFDVTVVGNDIGEEVEFTVTSIDNSNIAQALGFTSGQVNEGDLVGGTLVLPDVAFSIPSPIAFVLTDDYWVANDDFDEATATGTALERVDADGDTELRVISSTSITAELSLGTPDGLNMVLALGPVEAEIVDGQAFIGRSGGEGRGYIRGLLEDVDGVDDGRYDVANIFERSQSEEPNYLELFGLDVDFETRIDLPFSGAFGILDPNDHGFSFQSTLLRTTGGDAAGDPNDNTVSAADIATTVQTALSGLSATATASDRAAAIGQALLEKHFAGDARQLGLAALDTANSAAYLADLYAFSNLDADIAGARDALGALPSDYFDADSTAGYGPHYMALNLPTVGLFDCASILDLLNDPLALLNGLDMIMGTIDGFVSDFMSDIDLPVVGDNLAVGAGFFRDFRFDVIDPARDYLETPRADGTLPTTVDLINDFFNAALNDLVNFRALDVTDTAGDISLIAIDQLGEEPVFYGAIAFNVEIFREILPIEFALNIPGINLEVESAANMELRSQLDIAFGFGLDCEGGFFLLNSTTDGEEEIRLTFEAELLDGSGGAEFELSIGGALSVTAEVVTAGEAGDNQNIAGRDLSTGPIADADNRTGATAVIGLDLFGQSGTANGEIDGGRTYDFTQSNFLSLVSETTIGGTALLTDSLFDRTVYISQLNFSEFAEFTFNADIDAHLDLTAEFTGGVSFIPAVYTDFIFSARIPEASFGPGGLNVTADLLITRLEFADIHVDVGDIRDAVVGILGPIKGFLDPIADVFETLGSAVPINYALGAIETVFPVVNVVKQITAIFDLLTPSAGNEYLCIGSMDFLGVRGDTVLTDYTIHQALFKPCIDFDYNIDFNLSSSVKGPGLYIEIPILQDPTQALNLLLGKFDQVNMFEVDFNLLEADIKADIAGEILGSIGLPGWAASVIRGGFRADIDIYFKAGMTMGYDLSGLVNFANTLDPERLLDGIYIESQPGSLIDGQINASMGLNAGIARASGGINATIQASFLDPNNDGKLRLPELIDRFEASANEFAMGNIGSALEEVFTGQFKVDFFLNFWAGINLPWPLPDLGWGFGINESILNFEFGADLIDVEIENTVNNTSYLNIGAAAGNNMSSMSQDGNDAVTFSGRDVYWSSNGQAFVTPSGSTRTLSTNAIVMNLGEGTNTVDFTGLGTECMTTITYSGDLNDAFNLPDCGTHVIFAGDGVDTFTGGGNGTYIIFAEAGADIVNLSSGTTGNIIVITGDDYGMRDHFLQTFTTNGSTAVNNNNIMTALDAINDGTSFADFENAFTALSQLSEDRDDETVTLTGSGFKKVFSGKGDDVIESYGGGVTKILSGAGGDTVRIYGGGTNVVEAGAGDDLVILTGNGSNTIYGWGVGEAANEQLARRDGDDILLGGTGSDTMNGQFGNDILSGSLGSDNLTGGKGDDLISGGTLELRLLGETNVIDLTAEGALQSIQSGLTITSEAIADDGADILSGNEGRDVLMGGSNSDTLDGGASADLIIGDFGVITVSNQRITQEFISTEITSGLGGTDQMEGGTGGDILIAGGAGGGTTIETITDLSGNNTVFGDFGWVQGSNLLVSPSLFRSIASVTPTGGTFGSRDDITTGAGNDVIFGGELNDTITAGTGGDFIFGDLGSFVPIEGSMSNDIYDPTQPEGSRVLTNELMNEGNDTIILGEAGADDLFDLVVGGGGGDIVTSVNGGLVFIGDYGSVQLNPEGVKALREFKSDAAPSSDSLELTPAELEQIEADIAAQLLSIERIVKSLETVQLDSNGNVLSVYGAIDGLALGDQRFGNDSITTTMGGNVYTVLGGGNDTANLADGLSYIIADDGQLGISFVDQDEDMNPLDPTLGFITGRSVSTQFAGNDTITTAGERDIILTGDGADVVNAGDGLNLAIMDNGLLTTSDDAYAFPTNLTSVAGAGDGNDSYTGGSGDDLVIMGGGGTPAVDGFTDRADLGDGTNFALGDSGSIQYDLDIELDGLGVEHDVQIINLASDPLSINHNDGADLITAGASDDFVILGLGADQANLGSGAAFLLGSAGTVDVTKRQFGTLLDVAINSYDLIDGVLDADDSITNGLGDEYMVLGLGADDARLGDGQTHILASEGSLAVTFEEDGSSIVDMQSMPITAGHIAHNPQQFDGNDYIQSGLGKDFLVLGLGSDEVALGEGSVHIQASEGSLRYEEDANGFIDLSIQSLPTVLGVVDGNETITGGAGDDFVVLGLGSDIANMGSGATYAVGGEGDLAYRTTDGMTELSLVSETTLPGQIDGNDTITSTDGRDFMVLGLGADDLNSGTGDLHVISSAGRIDFTETTTGGITRDLDMLSAEVVLGYSDGNDIINNGIGAEYAILGLGSDTANFGDGGLHLIGGEGEIRFDLGADDEYELYMISQAVVPLQQDGREVITSGEGDDFVILGLGNDDANVGNGFNRVIGDQAEIDFRSNRSERITSTEPSYGGNDTIVTGNDADVVILSSGEDHATTNGGDDLVIGDNGEITKNYISNDHRMTAFADAFGNSDIIVTGLGNDLIMGAYGDDIIMTGADEDFALGDLGDVTFRNYTDVETLTYLLPEIGGNDTISAEGAGDNILIGQAGEDVIDGADDDDLLIGDLAELTLRSVLARFAGQSAMDRVEDLEFTGTDLIYDDRLFGEAGSDFLIGGYGNDYLRGGDDQDFLFGDTIQIFREYDDVTGIEFMLQETNYPFDLGGYDDMDGGAGPDILIGGLGEDLLAGNTQTDLIYGDSVAVEFEAQFDSTLDYLDQPTPHRVLKKVNFAGSNPVDLVSNSQTGSSTGVFLSTNSFLTIFDEIGYSISGLNDLSSFNDSLTNSLSLVEHFFDNNEMIMRLAEAFFMGTTKSDILEELMAEFQEFIVAKGLSPADIDFNLLQYLLKQVIKENSADVPVEVQKKLEN